MALSPVLIVGAGGSGGKTLRSLRQTLLRRLRAKGWHGDIPAAWQFLEIDTVSVQSREGFPADLLPPEDYLGLVARDTQYRGLREAMQQRTPSAIHLGAFGGWLPEDTEVNIAQGAGQYRTIGRAVGLTQLSRIAEKLSRSYARMTAGGAAAELKEVARILSGKSDQVNDQPIAIVVSSVAGGSGAGIFLDVSEALKSINPDFAKTTHTFLYGPDVFTSVPQDLRDQIPANVLGSIGEIVSGVWSPGLSGATASLYQTAGLVARGSTGFGSRCNYIIGASNAKGVSFANQEQIYLSAGESLASFVADENIQDWFIKFVNVNVFINSSNEIICDDNSQLRVNNDPKQPQPLAAIGVGRVSLGMERFKAYLAEGLAKANIQRLLWPKYEPEDPNNPKTLTQLVNERVDRGWSNFLQASGLNERGDSNQVLEALTPSDSKEKCDAFASKALIFAEQGVDAAGLSSDQWVERLLNFFRLQQKGFEVEDRAATCKVAQVWVGDIQKKLLALVSQSIASSGLAVSIDLLRKLREEVVFVSKEELPKDAAAEIRKLDQLPSKLRGELPTNMAKIQSAAMRQAIQPRLSRAVQLVRDSNVMTIASELLVDLEVNFLGELENSLVNLSKQIDREVEKEKEDNGDPNRFNSFVDIPSGVIPSQYRASEVEKLLIDPQSYPSLLEELIKKSSPQSTQYWWDRAIERSLLGTLIDDRGDSATPKLIDQVAPWLPNNSDYRQQGSEQKSLFRIIHKPDDYEMRNREWLEDTSTTLGKYLAQSLVEYLIHPNPTIQGERRDTFSRAFDSALDVAAPLCKLNNNLLGKLHPKVLSKDPFLLQLSAIPFENQGELAPLYDITKNLMTAKNLWNAKVEQAFSSTANVQSIDMFTCTPVAMNPMAFTSLMKPIAESWGSASAGKELAKGFWTNRRARPLVESLPLAPQVILEMVRGWFIAGILEQRNFVKDQSDIQKARPKGSIWVSARDGFVNFPHPMLPMQSYAHENNPELLVTVLKSVSLAMVECHTSNSLEPLAPYWRLKNLGSDGAFQEALSNWIRKGTLDEGAPTPIASRAGSKDDSFASRKEIVSKYFQSVKESLTRTFQNTEKEEKIFHVPRIYEISRYVTEALDDIIDHITTLEDTEGLAY